MVIGAVYTLIDIHICKYLRSLRISILQILGFTTRQALLELSIPEYIIQNECMCGPSRFIKWTRMQWKLILRSGLTHIDYQNRCPEICYCHCILFNRQQYFFKPHNIIYLSNFRHPQHYSNLA